MIPLFWLKRQKFAEDDVSRKREYMYFHFHFPRPDTSHENYFSVSEPHPSRRQVESAFLLDIASKIIVIAKST